MSDEIGPDDQQRSRPLRLRSIDAEFAHTVVEVVRWRHETRGGSGGTTNHPARFTQDLHDVLAFDCLKFHGPSNHLSSNPRQLATSRATTMFDRSSWVMMSVAISTTHAIG